MMGACCGYSYIACHKGNENVLKCPRMMAKQRQLHLLGVVRYPESVPESLDETLTRLWKPRALLAEDRGHSYCILSPDEGYSGMTKEQRDRDAGLFGRPIDHLLTFAQLRARFCSSWEVQS